MNDLRDRALHSVRWNTISIGFTTLFQVIQMIWLARLLAPEDFGVMAIVWVVIRLANPVTQGGISQAIIQAPSINQVQLTSVFWLSFITGVLMFLALLLIRRPLATFFNSPELTQYLLLAGILFLIAPVGNIFQAAFSRNLEFRKLARVQIAGQLAELLVAIALAYRGAGALSLLWGVVSRYGVTTMLAMGQGWKTYASGWTFQWREIRSLASFAAYEAGSLTINAVNVQIDKVIIGKMLGLHTLGLYIIIWELMIIPVSRINPILMRVAYPVFSRMQNDLQAINRYFTKTIEILSTVNIPALVGLALLAQPFLSVVYGPAWKSAGTALSILTFAGMYKAFSGPGASVLLARGRADILFLWNLIWTLFLGALLWFILILFPSLESAAWVQVAGALILSGIWFLLLKKYGGIQLKPVLGIAVKQVALILPMAAGVFLARQVMENDAGRLVVGIFAGLLIYAGALLYFRSAELKEFVHWLKPG
jgi:O-antigen/teichoic acid export membrane protein